MNHLLLLLLTLLLTACQSQSNRVQEPGVPVAGRPSEAGTPGPGATPTATPSPARGVKLALTAGALQLVDAQTGSTREVPRGRPLDSLVSTLTAVLGQPPTSVGVNEECGAGPLKMATWANGLTLAFAQKPRAAAAAGRQWQFVGWSLNPGRGAETAPTTMAGVGLGSTRAEVESAYVIKVTKSSLGYEFATSAGLYGLLDGAGPQARVSALWSGTSCVFR